MNQTNVGGRINGEERARRGGGWHNDPVYYIASFKCGGPPGTCYVSLGLRLVLSQLTKPETK